MLPEDAQVEVIKKVAVPRPSSGRAHRSTIDRLSARFILNLGDRAIVRVRGSVQLNEWSQPRPDLTLLRWRSGYYATHFARSADALLVMEVCGSTGKYGRDFTVPLYCRADIPEVWLFDLNRRRILVYREPTASGYRDTIEVRGPTPLSPLAFPDFRLTPDEIIL